MRVDKNDPRQLYEGFVDWLRQHPIWTIGLVFAYTYYRMTTEEV